MTDEEIVRRVRNGETRLFEELVVRYQDTVYGMAVRLLRVATDAEDAAQEAFLRAFRGLDRFEGEAAFSTWLYRILYNACLDWLRKRRRRASRSEGLDEADGIADARVDVEADLLAAEDRRRVRRIVDGLVEPYRRVVVLHYYRRLPYEEIAAILEVPVRTIETRLYRARRMIRRQLDRGERRVDT